MPDGESPGSWVPVLTEGTWRATLAAMRSRNPNADRVGAPGKLTNLLSGIATCDKCGAPAHIRWQGGKATGTAYCTVPPWSRQRQSCRA